MCSTSAHGPLSHNMSSAPLLNDITTSYHRAYPLSSGAAEKPHNNIRFGAADNRTSAATCEDARRQLEESLSLLCTSILIGGEQFVREFPSHLYVPVLTDILIAAHTLPPSGSGDGVNPLAWDTEEGSVASVTKVGKQSFHSPKGRRGRERPSAAPSTTHYVGFQVASPIELLATRALALIAGDVPRGSYALRTTKSPQTIPILAAYLSDTEFLVINDELTEELLKCFLYFTLVSHETCVDTNVPRRIVELLLVVEQQHLRVLCVQILSNMLARARESELEEVWTPVLALLLESLSGFIANSTFQLGAPAPASPLSSPSSPRQPLPVATADSISSPSRPPIGIAPAAAAAAAASGRPTVTPKDRILLSHYIECLAHALDRLFIEKAAMECHAHLIEQFAEVCVQLLRVSVLVSPLEERWSLRSLAMSPLVTLYLMSPTFAVPLLLRLHVWEVLCGCMLATVERKQYAPVPPRMAAPRPPTSTAAGVAGVAAVVDDNAAAGETRAASADASPRSATSSSALAGDESSSGSGSTSSSAAVARAGDASSGAPNDGASAQPNATSITSGPVLTTDVMTIPFIADEQELLPMLEFLLILTPSARRGHTHSDYRNITAPYFRWTWEDDFHNEMECNESLCRRLERMYQLTRHFRTHSRYAVTHGKQRIFYADFLSKVYLSDRKQRHSLHRRPLITGYVHDTRNALLHGCTCCAAEPDPLFTTWANHSSTQLRTADTGNSDNSRGGGYGSDNAANAGGDGASAEDATQRSPAHASLVPSLRSGGSNGRRRRRDDAATARSGSGAARQSEPSLIHTNSATAAAAAAPSETSTLGSRGRNAAEATSASRGGHSSGSHRPHLHSHSHLDPQEHHHRDSGGSGSRARDSTRTSTSRSRRRVAFADRDDADGDFEGDDDEGDDEDDTTIDDFASSYEGSRRGVRGGFSLCSCATDSSTAPRRAPMQRLRVPGGGSGIGAGGVDGSGGRNQRRAPITVTLLPLEAMLEDPMEKLQSDPATRNAFLGKDVLSRLVPTMMPALLSLLDNCVNPLVARHSTTLLLRCLSLCADLRTRVTGEAIELPTSSGPAAASPESTVAAAGKSKSGRRFLSFRKWITGGATAPRWQRSEWQATQTALRCFLPSLRDLFVGLYLMESVHIVAGRQDVFGAMKDDLLMADELARVHISLDFYSFQLSVPSEQLTTAADAMVLLMGLFPKAAPTNALPAAVTASASAKASGKNRKSSNFQKPPLPHHQIAAAAGTPTLSSSATHDSSAEAHVKSTHELRGNDAASPSLLPPFPPGLSHDGTVPLDPLSAAAAPAGEPSSHNASLPSSLPASATLVPDGAAGEVAMHRFSDLPAGGAAKALTSEEVPSGEGSAAQVGKTVLRPPSPAQHSPMHLPLLKASGSFGSFHSGSKKTLPSLPAATARAADGGGSGVFTLHQMTLLRNYARLVLLRAPRVYAAADQIEMLMKQNEFKSVVVLGSYEADPSAAVVSSSPAAATAAAPLRTKELTLRVSPEVNCPYHLSFSHCTNNFFHASMALNQALVKLGGAAAADVEATTTTTKEARGIWEGPDDASVSQKKDDEDAEGVGATRSHSDPNSSSSDRGNEVTADTGVAVAATAAVAAAAAEEDLPIGLKVTAVPNTIDVAMLYDVAENALTDSAGPYSRLPPALRAVLAFYDYCKRRSIELRAVVVEMPEFMLAIANRLQEWFNTVVRLREDEALAPPTISSASFRFEGSGAVSPLSFSDMRSPINGGSQHLRLDATTRGKVLALVNELGATVSRELGFASLSLDSSIIVKQPCTFAKRAKRMKAFGTVRHLVWRPLTVAFDVLSGSPTLTSAARSKTGNGGADSKTLDQPSTVLVHNVALSIVSGVKLRKTTFAVLPNTTMGSLAVAVAKQLQMPPPSSPSPHSSSSPHRKAAAQRSSAAGTTLHAVQERQHSLEQSASAVLTDFSPCLTSEEYFEGGNGTGSSASRTVSADRILFFINDEPMLSPLVTLLDGLTSYADSGLSLRHLVTMTQRPGDSEEVHQNKILVALPSLPFWQCKHEIKFVVLEEPLPSSLLTGDTLTSLWCTPNVRRCGCSGMEQGFFCSPRHLFELAPVNGAVALYAALTAIARNEMADEASVLDSSQRRLSSAVVHQLYQQLSMFMLPPLLYSSGIGAAVPGTSIRAVAQARRARPGMTFPTASSALWSRPSMFSMDMRVSILRFFISAQRSLSFEQCWHVLQGHQNLLVRRSVGEPNFGAEETRAGGTHGNNNNGGGGASTSGQADSADRRLDVVGLEWLSEEVLRRRRVTLTVDRRHVLQSAEQLFTLATCTLTLDVAFKGEAGIGPGPAMEFYELVAEELLKPEYGLFRTEEVPRCDSDADAGVESGGACSPAASATSACAPRRRSCNPLYPAGKQTSQTLHYWELLGLLLGRLLMMGETTSLSFHPLLLRRLVGEQIVRNPHMPSGSNMELLDAPLAASLVQLTKMSDAELEACDLYFTIPLSAADGFSPATEETPMMNGGERQRVTSANVSEYMNRLCTFYLQYVPDLALLHLRRGLQHTVNPLYLELFSAAELGHLFGSAPDAKIWESREHFARCIEAGHGYHKRSDVVQYLLDIVPQWSAPLQHSFLKFVTGSSCVPYGGLTQTIKVVRRDIDPANAASAAEASATHVSRLLAADGGATVSESAASATATTHSLGLNTAYDHTLPTVSTCFLYLKLPQYSSKAVLEERLRFAVCEGSNFFALT